MLRSNSPRLPQQRGRTLGSASSDQISDLLRHWGTGDRAVVETLLPVIYNELRRLAHAQLRQQRPNHTLQTTALVNEAYLRLAELKKLSIENRAHFLGIAAQLMRWILVDYEKKRRAARRGGGYTRLSFDDSLPASRGTDADLLALDEALSRLAALDEQQSQIVELRYFGGLSVEETSEFLGVSPTTVKRSWASARAWLLREMSLGAGDK